MDKIQKSFSADHLPPISQSPEKSKPRSASAPARLSGSAVCFRLTEPEKANIKIPTAFALNQEREAYSNYQAALTQQRTGKTSLWNSLFGPNAKKQAEKSLAVLMKLDHEDFHLDQAIKNSKKEFRAMIAAGGGNPDIAEEVFKHAVEVQDLDSSSFSSDINLASHAENLNPSEAAIGLESNGDDPWNDVESVQSDHGDTPSLHKKDSESIEDYSEKTTTTDSLQEFVDSIHDLSREEISSFIKSLPESEIRKFAAANMEQDLVEKFDTPSLQGQLIDLCCSMSRTAQQGIDLELPQAQRAIMDAFLEEAAPIENQGLFNSGVDCYLSSALQCLRNHVSNLSPARREELLTSLRTKYFETLAPKQTDSPLVAFGSPLVAFLENKFDGRNKIAAAFLRKEVHSIMERLAQSATNPSAAAIEMADSINPTTGNSRQQCDTSEALVALMEHLETPRILLEEKDTYLETGELRLSDNQQARQQGGELIVPFGVEKEGSLQEVINSNWVAKLTGANAVEDPDGSKHDIQRERALVNQPDSITISLARFRMKPDPTGGWAKNSRGEDIIGVPKLAIDASGRTIPEKLHIPISHLTDDITFPCHHHEGAQTETIYTPTSIICHYGGQSANSGHYAIFRKENEAWFLVNDAQVIPINLDGTIAHGSDMTYRNFLEKNAYVVNLKMATSSSPRFNSEVEHSFLKN